MAVLSIDHIDGGGTQHRKQLREQGTIFYRWVIKNNYPEGFQVLCFNCNRKKYMNDKSVPHKNDDDYVSVPLKEDRKVKVRYVHKGKLRPSEFPENDS